ncbi:MAG: hypothetical protein RL637_1129 [Pseudomonadota bacterium]|jgi:molybdate transport system ATP-binding protein
MTVLINCYHKQGEFELIADLILPAQGISVLFGHSGSGKTTLLKCIAGLQRPIQGLIKINGQYWQRNDPPFFLPTHQRRLGYVFQQAHLFPHLTVKQNLQYGIKRVSHPPSTEYWQFLLQLFDIEFLLARYPHSLSGGERQRVAIARALATQPQLLLMDEPLANLDYLRKQEILPFLTQLTKQFQIPIIYVTHDLQELIRLADYVVILHSGKIMTAGGLTETLAQLSWIKSEFMVATTVWLITIMTHDQENGLTEIESPAGRLYLPYIKANIGNEFRLQIGATDVSICLEYPQFSSILNILPAEIKDCIENNQQQLMVRLHLNQQPLLAQITRKSWQQLHLQIGMKVYVQIKSTALII